MVGRCIESLDLINLMRLYGRIHFTWNLHTDQIVWNGPIDKLFGTDTPLTNGCGFLTCLTPESFWKRFADIEGRQRKKGSETFSASYSIILPDQTPCQIIEEGRLIKKNEGMPEFLEGTICVKDDINHMDYPRGDDELAGYPSREVLYENLAVLMDQNQDEEAPGGYVTFCMDRLSLIYFVYGMNAMCTALVQVASTLKRFTRFNDVIGRPSGCSFGIVLKDADEWGVFQAADRLLKTCSQLAIETPKGTFSPTLSGGGSAFRKNALPLSVIQQAEQSLFEMQNMRETGFAFAEHLNTKDCLERPNELTPGKRRLTDR